ncbi:MAG: CcmD family protein [Cyclobacteriaceae bacterium]|nr:CcmD family protein [Cyclobacteriaceae bacterium]
MKHTIYKVLIASLMVFMVASTALGQEKYSIDDSDYTNTNVEMADQFRAEGKIYVVVAVVLLILAGMFVYIIRTDRKAASLEKKLAEIKGLDKE